MLLKKNFLESLTIFCCSGTLSCVLLNCVTDISPINGVWFVTYILLIVIASLIGSIRLIQWFLNLNKPIVIDASDLVDKYPYLKYVLCYLPTLPKKLDSNVPDDYKEYDTNELSVISTVLERKLVSSWYLPYISQEIGFPFACKQLLDQMIGKSFQISNKIDTKEVFIDICTLITVHFKEFRKAQKRHESSPDTPIAKLYKTTFTNENISQNTADSCIKILRVIFKEIIPWELWDTPHSELLIRILSKKLDNYIDTTLSDPAWLNNQLFKYLQKNTAEASTEDTSNLTDTKESEIKTSIEITKSELNITDQETKKTDIKERDSDNQSEKTIETALSTLLPQTTAPVLQRPIENPVNGDNNTNVMDTNVAEAVEIQSSPVLRQKRGRQGKNEVKIYDRVIEGSVKTWETDMDLQCISMGQDLLASLDGEITLSRLWGQEAEADSPGLNRGKSPQPLWFGEEEIDLDSVDSPPKKESSPKPTEVLLKDLQSTVSQAKSKIGDLQDEAAGMMEGLLDFGIAGLKKGLRFTGLGDEAEKLMPQKSNGHSPTEDRGKANGDRDEHTINNIPPLVKQNRVTSQDSVPLPLTVGATAPLAIPRESPEPQYEEAADLSTSIAKLRTLLQQRADFQREDGVWWDPAEETRGRTQTHLSTRPVDTAALADEYDMSERNTSPLSTNNMQRLDKLFHRTVTGVFNSLRTAVGDEDISEVPARHTAWRYVSTGYEMSVCGAVSRLVGSRRAASHVDAALDSLADIATVYPRHTIPADLEEWCAHSVCAYSAASEWCAAVLPRTHVAHRLYTVVIADISERFINEYLNEMTGVLKKQIFSTFERMSDDPSDDAVGPDQVRSFELDETCALIINNLPGILQLFGEDPLKDAVRFVVSSFSYKEINKDLILKCLQLVALYFSTSAGLRNCSLDN